MFRTSLLCAAFALTAAARVMTQEVRAEKFVLDNGLQVILHQDRALPIATVNVWYYVGSKDERAGRSGFAHLFEHLMFMGTKRVPGSGFDDLMEKGGGANNASTSSDRTNYYSWGPAELLPTLLWLEADRMEDFGKALTQEKLDKQREVVRNERRQVVEMRPYGKAGERLGKLLYPPAHGYHTSVIGSHKDLEAATVQDVQDFFATYYIPNNASLVVAGDFDIEATKKLVRELFASLPRGARVPRKAHRDRAVFGTRRWTGYDRVSFPKVTMVWKTVKLFGRGDADLDIVAGILGSGKNARLYRRLVAEEKLAADVSVYQWSRQLGGEFHIEVTAKPGADLARVEAIVREELRRLAEDGPSKDEIERQRSSIEYDFVTSMESLRDRADKLNSYNFHLGKPDGFAFDLMRYKHATRDSLRSVCKRYLVRDDCLVQTVLPEARAAKASARDTAPAVASGAEFRFQKPTRFRLSNGIEVQHWQRDAVPLVRVALQTKLGTLVDKRAHAGRCTLMTKMLEEGAGARDSFAFASELERLGAQFRTEARANALRVSLQSLASKFPQAAELWRDAIVAPRLADADWKRTRSLHRAGIEQSLDDPSSLARRIGYQAFYGRDHPYGIPSSGTTKSVDALSLDDVRAAHRAMLRPEQSTIFIAGAIDKAQARALLEKLLGTWRVEGPAATPPKIPAEVARPARVFVVHRPRSPQTVVRFMMPGPKSSTPDQAAYRVLNTILGGSFTSRLNANLREKHGYTYGAGSSFVMWPQTGIFLASSSVQQRYTGKALAEFLREFRRMRSGDVSAAEAEKGRSTNRQGLVSSLGGLSGLLGMAMEMAIEGSEFGVLDARLQEIAALDREALNALAKRAVPLEQASLILVGKQAAILKQLEGLGLPKPTFLDRDGVPLPATGDGR